MIDWREGNSSYFPFVRWRKLPRALIIVLAIELISTGLSLWSRTKHPAIVYSSSIKYLLCFSERGHFILLLQTLLVVLLRNSQWEKLTIVHFLLLKHQNVFRCYLGFYMRFDLILAYWLTPACCPHPPLYSILQQLLKLIPQRYRNPALCILLCYCKQIDYVKEKKWYHWNAEYISIAFAQKQFAFRM